MHLRLTADLSAAKLYLQQAQILVGYALLWLKRIIVVVSIAVIEELTKVVNIPPLLH